MNRNISISDVTLRQNAGQNENRYTFREKIEIARLLDRIGIDVVETAPLNDPKTDILLLHTIAPLMQNSILCCPVGMDEKSVSAVWDALKTAKRVRLQVSVPTSPVCMEYRCHKKPKAVAEAVPTLVAACRSLCTDVEFRAEDATRAEPEFLCGLIRSSIAAGASVVTLCDNAGILLPDETAKKIEKLYAAIPELKNVTLSVECSDAMNVGTACAAAAMSAGAGQVKTTSCGNEITSLSSFAYLLKQRGDSLGVSCAVNQTAVAQTTAKIHTFQDGKQGMSSKEFSSGDISADSVFTISRNDDENTVAGCIAKLGYELSKEDIDLVYENVRRVAEKKTVGARELDAIIASAAMQAPPTYVLKSYVSNSGNVITSTAHVVLEKNGEVLQGISTGDGPIDAAFRAVEQITGHHFELDDFQIQSVTEGREAVGQAIVKLRASGKLYSGRGISTDIIGASVRAYISALNKICSEEA